MSEKRKIAKTASVVGGATLLSRIFGFVRDMIVAQLFGAGMATDAFFVAFRIPNLLRRLVGEGSLTASFIPVYSEYISQKSKEEGDELVSASFSVLAIVLILLTGLGVLFSPWIIKLMAYGFSLEPEKFKLTVLLTRLMFPYIFFIGLVALAMGILNSWKHFAAPALAPVLLNLAIIACALLFSGILKEPILSLAFGVLLGGIVQLLFQIPFISQKKNRGAVPFPPFPPRSETYWFVDGSVGTGFGGNPAQCFGKHLFGIVSSRGKHFVSLLCRPTFGIPHGNFCHCHRHGHSPHDVRADGEKRCAGNEGDSFLRYAPCIFRYLACHGWAHCPALAHY